jgi:hypothetical protein
VQQYCYLLSQSSEFFSHKPPYYLSLGVKLCVLNVTHFPMADLKEKCIWIKCLIFRKNRFLSGFLNSNMGRFRPEVVSIQVIPTQVTAENLEEVHQQRPMKYYFRHHWLVSTLTWNAPANSEDLNMQWISMKSVPRLLSNEQKQGCVVYQELLKSETTKTSSWRS